MASLLLIQLLTLISNRAIAQHSEWSLKPDTLVFAARSARISAAARSKLFTLKEQMEANPDFKVVIEGIYDYGEKGQQVCWNRVMAVIKHMSDENNIDRNRFIFRYHGGGPLNSVIYRVPYDGEEGTNRLPYPPPMRRSRDSPHY